MTVIIPPRPKKKFCTAFPKAGPPSPKPGPLQSQDALNREARESAESARSIFRLGRLTQNLRVLRAARGLNAPHLSPSEQLRRAACLVCCALCRVFRLSSNPRHSCRNGNLEPIWIPTPRHSRRSGNPEPFPQSNPTRFVSAGMFQLGRQPVRPARLIWHNRLGT